MIVRLTHKEAMDLVEKRRGLFNLNKKWAQKPGYWGSADGIDYFEGKESA